MIAAYEELRRQLLNGQRGPGLALFMRRGMRQWMNACSLCVAPSPPKEFTATPDEAVLPQGARTEIVLILAGMLLQTRGKDIQPNLAREKLTCADAPLVNQEARQ